MLNIRLTPTAITATASVVKVDVPTALDLPTAARMATPLPANGFDACPDCGGDLDVLTGNNGLVSAVFCAHCGFGN